MPKHTSPEIVQPGRKLRLYVRPGENKRLLHRAIFLVERTMRALRDEICRKFNKMICQIDSISIESQPILDDEVLKYLPDEQVLVVLFLPTEQQMRTRLPGLPCSRICSHISTSCRPRSIPANSNCPIRENSMPAVTPEAWSREDLGKFETTNFDTTPPEMAQTDHSHILYRNPQGTKPNIQHCGLLSVPQAFYGRYDVGGNELISELGTTSGQWNIPSLDWYNMSPVSPQSKITSNFDPREWRKHSAMQRNSTTVDLGLSEHDERSRSITQSLQDVIEMNTRLLRELTKLHTQVRVLRGFLAEHRKCKVHHSFLAG